ncbi:MAG: asparagine synthetase B, partial [Flavobacterium sp.]|nr:asparagine synthetase B [Flavobacterium sp.]
MQLFKKYSVLLVLLFSFSMKASFILLPMDESTQQNHLKAYGITFWALEEDYKVSWLLNYRGGSFLLPDAQEIRKECQIRGVSFEILSDGQANA